MERPFDPDVPIERALTPPSAWYTDPAIHQTELGRVFRHAWQPVGRVEQLRSAGDFLSGDLFGEPFLVVLD
ncbi:MAG TPA: hypothetical protein VD788_17160, partial [Candidatus Polarisedimenticolaceae bacterium]|nr:hypothetical protein [Candidatus Polarisedimenticolaceae bacterium]